MKTPSSVILRLKVEEKKPSAETYSPKTILFIEEIVAQAIRMYGIEDKLFEVSVKTKNDKMISCQIKMSFEIFRYFIRAYGSIDLLERDYEIIEKYN